MAVVLPAAIGTDISMSEHSTGWVQLSIFIFQSIKHCKHWDLSKVNFCKHRNLSNIANTEIYQQLQWDLNRSTSLRAEKGEGGWAIGIFNHIALKRTIAQEPASKKLILHWRKVSSKEVLRKRLLSWVCNILSASKAILSKMSSKMTKCFSFH